MQPAPGKMEGVNPKVLRRVSSWDKLIADTLLEVTAAHSKPLDAFCLPSSSAGANLVPAADPAKPLQTAQHTPAMQSALQAPASGFDATGVTQPGDRVVAPSALASCTAIPEPVPDQSGCVLGQGLQLTQGSAHSYQPPAPEISSHTLATLPNRQQKQQRTTSTDAGLGGIDVTTCAVAACPKVSVSGSSAVQDAAIAAADPDHSSNAASDAAHSDDGIGLSRLIGREQHPRQSGSANPSAPADGVLDDANKPGQLPAAMASCSASVAATAGSTDSREQRLPPIDHDTHDAASAGNELHETIGMDPSWASGPQIAGMKGINEQVRPTNKPVFDWCCSRCRGSYLAS